MAARNSGAPRRAPWPVRARMAALERVSPSRGAVVAERLWYTVPPPPSPARQKRFTPEGGRPFFLMSGRSEVAGMAFGPTDGPIALLVHGWGGHWQQLSAHIPGLVEAGYQVVAHDAPAHGRSTHGAEGPGRSSVLEMTRAVADVCREVGQPRLVLAHSLGAMAALRATRWMPPADAYVLLAPEVHLGPAVDWFAGVTGTGPRTRRVMVDRLEERIGVDLGDFDTTRDAARLAAAGHLPALLAVHDTLDADTPSSETEQLVAAWPGAELQLTTGLGHRSVIWDPQVVARVAAFVHHLDHDEVTRLHP